MDKSDLNNRQKGQLLIEAMVAVSLMLVGLLGIFGVLSRSLGLSRVAADQFVAVNLASEGIEIAKNILDSNYKAGAAWNAGFSTDGTNYRVGYQSEVLNAPGCKKELYLNSQGYYDCQAVSGVSSKFTRVLEVENVGPNQLNVISKVNWTGRGGLKSEIEVEDHFYSWRYPAAQS
ncbi:MAG: prepilin-type N-terminal cleavage/methylation domain-containing protein [bacterium]|nr:prepilin-type N-terminal cleavage/methylation domain-containing protein [bacterium]MDZ4231181.1 prepilin-type N-terminal cleavage/methylation domain-containing protein [Patescibacteria group bacterium]